MKSIWLAEFIGTFFMIFLGCGSLIAQQLGYMENSYAAFIFGGSVLAMIATFGHISFAHFNPAVSIGFFVLKRISFKQLLLYWSAEFSGALLASLFHLIIFGNDHSFGGNFPSPAISMTGVFLAELLGSFMLMGVITVVAFDERVHKALPALAIGTTVMIISLALGPLSGGSFNPARTLAPAIFNGHLEYLALYFTATILGACSGAMIISKIQKLQAKN